MRVGCGLFMLLLAAGLGWGAFTAAHNASNAGGVGDWLTNKKEVSRNASIQLGVGAAIFGILGLIVLAAGAMAGGVDESAPSNQSRQGVDVRIIGQSLPAAQKSYSPANQATIEQRLAKLDELVKKGLISEQECEKRRQQILAEL